MRNDFADELEEDEAHDLAQLYFKSFGVRAIFVSVVFLLSRRKFDDSNDEDWSADDMLKIFVESDSSLLGPIRCLILLQMLFNRSWSSDSEIGVISSNDIKAQ